MKYTVFINTEEEPLLETNSWNAAVSYLMEQDDFVKEGRKYYGREREGLFNEDHCLEFIEENIRDLAHWNNYRIEEKKS